MRPQAQATLIKIVSSLLIATLITFCGIPVAQAHTKLIAANPAAASEVSEWPTQITLEFDEELQKKRWTPKQPKQKRVKLTEAEKKQRRRDYARAYYAKLSPGKKLLRAENARFRRIKKRDEQNFIKGGKMAFRKPGKIVKTPNELLVAL